MDRNALFVVMLVVLLATLLYFSDGDLTGFVTFSFDALEVSVNESLIASSMRVDLNDSMRIVRIDVIGSGIGAEPYVRIAGREYALASGAISGMVVGAGASAEDALDSDRLDLPRSGPRTDLRYADGAYDIDNDGIVGPSDAVDFFVEDSACVVWSVVSTSASLFCRGDEGCCSELGLVSESSEDPSRLVLTRETADGAIGRVLARTREASFSEPLSFDFTGVPETFREYDSCGEACSIDHVARFIEVGTRTGRFDVDSIIVSYAPLNLVDETRISYDREAAVSQDLSDRLSRGERVRMIVRNESGFHVEELRRAQFDALVSEGLVAEAVVDQPVSVFTDDALELTNVASVQASYDLSGSGVTVCVVDTGVDVGLLRAERVDYEGWNVLTGTDDVQDGHGHGTRVAYPLIRAAPDASFVFVKALDDSGVGYESDVLRALDVCADRGADVISLSIGSGLYDGLCDANIVAARVNELVANGTLVVAAAGNEGGPLLKSPACASNATAVIASDDADALWSGSSYLEGHAVLSAPGVSIATVDEFGNPVIASGTSMATPFVSGAAALLLENASYEPLELRALLLASGDVVEEPFSFRRLDLERAILGVTVNLSEPAPPAASENGSYESDVATLSDVVSSGLIRHYPMVRGANDQIIYDESPFQTNGTRGSTSGTDASDPTWRPDGKVLYFSGSDIKVQGGTTNLPSGNTDLTVMVVARRNSTGGDTVQGVFGYGAASDRRVPHLHFYPTRMQFGTFNDDLDLYYDHDLTPTVATWRYNASSLLLEGIANDFESTNSTTLGGTPNWDSTGILQIGQRGTNGAEYLTGSVYYFLMYNRTLTDAEVSQNYVFLEETLAARGIYLSGTEISSCQTISTPGRYYLNQNLSSTGTCFTISTSDVAFTCGGHTITYNSDGAGSSEYGVLINSGLDNVSVNDCTFVNTFTSPSNSNGIRAQGTSGSPITNLTISRISGTHYSLYNGLIRLDYAHGAHISDSNLTSESPSGNFAFGVRAYDSENVTYTGMRVITNGADPRGISMERGHGSIIANSTFIAANNGSNDQNQMVNLIGVRNVQILNSTFEETTGTGTGGIVFNGANHTIMRDLYSNGTGATIFYFFSSNNENNTIYDSNLTATGTGETRSIAFTNGATGDLRVVNTSYASVYYDAGDVADLHRGYYVDLHVTDIFDDPVSGASINYTDAGTYSADNPSSSGTGLLTGGTGSYEDLVLYAYTENSSGTYYHNNYTFNASGLGITGSAEQNITSNTQVDIMLGTPISSCQTISSPGTYYLTQNVSSTGTCFTIASSDVTLGCFGHTINYADSSAGRGVFINNGLDTITIRDCILNQTATPGADLENSAVYINGTSSVPVEYISLLNNSYYTLGNHNGVRMTNTNFVTINDSILVSTGTSAVTNGFYSIGSDPGRVSGMVISNATMTGPNGAFIRGDYTDGSIIRDVNITSTASSGSTSRAVSFFNSIGTFIERTNVTLQGTAGRAVRLRGPDNTIRDSIISYGNSANAFDLDQSGEGGWIGTRIEDTQLIYTGGGTGRSFNMYGTSSTVQQLYLINTTFNKSQVFWGESVNPGDSVIHVAWRIGAYVNDTSGNPIGGARIAWESVAPEPAQNDVPTGSGTTGNSGWFRGGSLYEYRFNQTDEWYFQNHSVTASRAGYEDNSTHVNMSTNQEVVFTLSAITPDIPTITYVDPTPADDTLTNATNATINISMSMDTLYEFNFTWDGTESSFYDPNLMLMFNFDNNSALGENNTHVYDLSGRGNNGSIGTGITHSSSGRYDGAFVFDTLDNDGAIVMDASTDFDFNSSVGYSVFTWFKKDTVCNSPDNDNEVMISRRGIGSTENTWWFGCRHSASATPNALTVNFYPSGGTFVTPNSGSTQINDGLWHHGGWVWDPSTNNVTLYLDGEAVATAEVTSFPGEFTSTDDMCIGAYSVGCVDYEFGGMLDEIRMYKRALNPDEVRMQYWSNLQRYNETEWRFISTPDLDVAPKTYTYSADVTSFSLDTASAPERSITTASGISSCQTISSAGSYVLTQNVSSTGTCFPIESDNVNLSCGGYTITYDTGNNGARYGVHVDGDRDNLVVQDCTIVSTSTGTNSHAVRAVASTRISNITVTRSSMSTTTSGRGVLLQDVDNPVLTHLDISTGLGGSFAHGIDLIRTNNALINDSNVTTTASSAAGLFLGDKTNNTVAYRLNLSTSNTGAPAIYVYWNATNNTVYDSFLAANTNLGIRHLENGAATDLYLVNVTGNLGTTWDGASASSEIHVGWWVDLYASDGSSGVSEAVVNYSDSGASASNPTISGTGLTTDGSGYYRDLILYEYTIDDTSTVYHTNYTFNVSATGYDALIDESRNITTNTQLNFTFSSLFVENVLISSSSGTNTSGENLSVSYDALGSGAVYNTTDWRVNGTSIAVVNMPFNVNVSSLASGAVLDLSTYGNNGTLDGRGPYVSPEWNASCKIGGCYTFEGALAAAGDEEHINLGSSVDFDSSEFTYLFWVYPNGITSLKRDNIILGRETYLTQGFRAALDADTGVEWWADESGGTLDLNSGTPIPEGVWSHIGLRYNGTHGSIFVNGTVANTVSGTYVVPVGDALVLNGAIGGASGSNSSIDEFLYFDRSLSDEQIKAIYDEQNAGGSVDTIVSQETLVGENWSVAVTTSDLEEYSVTVLSENLTILNGVPVVESVSITSSSSTNTSEENLSVTFDATDPDGSSVVNTTDWRMNGTSIAALNAPLNANISSLTAGSIIDLSSYANNGTLGSGVASYLPVYNESCVVGGCYLFDGSNDVIDFGDPADGSLDFGTTSFSYGLWVYPTAFVSSWDVPLFKGGNTASNAGYDIELGSGSWSAGVGDGTTAIWANYAPGGSINQWAFVLAVVDRENDNLSLYINGTYAASADISALGSVSNSFNLTLGRQNTLVDLYQGYIDEVQVYSRALSSEQVAAIYTDQLAGRSIDTIVSQETLVGENWSVAVTSADGISYSTSVLSENLTILETPSLDCQTIDTPGSYVMSQNVSAAGTCFTINVSDVSLDCAGYTINYSTADTEGYGILIWSQSSNVNNVNISNCNVIKDSPGGSSSSRRDGIVGYGLDLVPSGSLPDTGGTIYRVDDVNIYNVTVTTNGDYSYGISGIRTEYWNISSSTVTTDGSRAYGVRGSISLYWNLDNINITTLSGPTTAGIRGGVNSHDWTLNRINSTSTGSSDTHAIFVFYSNGWNISNSTFTSGSVGADGFRASNSGNIRVYDSTFTGVGTYDLRTDLASASRNIYLINVSYNDSKVQYESSGLVSRAWYIDLYVNDSAGTPLVADLNYTDSGTLGSNPTSSATGLTTGADGFLRDQIIYEYSENITSRYYHTNYTFNVSNASYNLLTEDKNFTTNTQLTFTLNNFDPPNVTLLNPATDWVTNDDPLFECRAESTSALVNVSLYTNASGWSQVNTTATSGTNSTVQLSTSGLAEGSYEWSCYACTADLCAFASENRTFTVDTTAPVSFFVAPTPNASDTISDTFVFINVTSSDTHNHSTFLDWNGTLRLWSAFDEYNATHVFDRSAQSNNGTLVGGPELVEGYYGKGFRFNTTSSITIPNVLT